MLGQQVADRAQRRHLGHAPGMHDERAELRVSNCSLIARGAAEPPITTRRSASSCFGSQRVGLDVLQQHQPDRRHAERHRHLLVAQQLVDALAVEPGSRQHQLGAGHRAGVRHAPRIDVKHRHDQQQRFGRRNAEAVSDAGAIRVQDRRAMRKQHALGIAGRARRVAQRRRGVLVEHGPFEIVVLRADQFLVAEQIRDVQNAGMCARSVIATKPLTVVISGPSFSISGANVRSKNRYWSSA